MTNSNLAVLHSSERHNWETPRALFERIQDCLLPTGAWSNDATFALDAAATPHNALCPRYHTETSNGLASPWDSWTWCNPPYGRAIVDWMRKACHEWTHNSVCSALLVPARTETQWFDMAMRAGARVLFLRGRVKFGLRGQPGDNGAPFPSCVLFFGEVDVKTCRQLGHYMEVQNG